VALDKCEGCTIEPWVVMRRGVWEREVLDAVMGKNPGEKLKNKLS